MKYQSNKDVPAGAFLLSLDTCYNTENILYPIAILFFLYRSIRISILNLYSVSNPEIVMLGHWYFDTRDDRPILDIINKGKPETSCDWRINMYVLTLLKFVNKLYCYRAFY